MPCPRGVGFPPDVRVIACPVEVAEGEGGVTMTGTELQGDHSPPRAAEMAARRPRARRRSRCSFELGLGAPTESPPP